LSAFLPLLLYIAFITIILSITFPNGIKSAKNQHRETPMPDLSEEQGELNRIFHGDKEIVEILSENSDPSNTLKFAFRKADSNADGFLTIRELAKYINLKIQDHIDTAIKRNPQIFAEIDKSPADGLVTWEEYHAHFLKNLKLDLESR
jgi:hypothetical protein